MGIYGQLIMKLLYGEPVRIFIRLVSNLIYCKVVLC